MKPLVWFKLQKICIKLHVLNAIAYFEQMTIDKNKLLSSNTIIAVMSINNFVITFFVKVVVHVGACSSAKKS